MDIILIPLINIVLVILQMLVFSVFVMVILNWLTLFGIINPYNRFIILIQEFFGRLFEPMLQPIRRILPNLGGIDLSPVVLILAFYLLQGVLVRILLKL